MLSLEIQGLTEHDFGEILKTHIWQLNQYKEHEIKQLYMSKICRIMDRGGGIANFCDFVPFKLSE